LQNSTENGATSSKLNEEVLGAMSISRMFIENSDLANTPGIRTVFTECIFYEQLCAVDRPLINRQISLKMDYKYAKKSVCTGHV